MQGHGGSFRAGGAAVDVCEEQEKPDFGRPRGSRIEFFLNIRQYGPGGTERDVGLQGFQFDFPPQLRGGDPGGDRRSISRSGLPAAETYAEEFQPEFVLRGGGQAADGFKSLLGSVDDGQLKARPGYFEEHGRGFSGRESGNSGLRFCQQNAGRVLTIRFR